MNQIEFKQHPLLDTLWLMYVGEQIIGTLNKEAGTVTIFAQTMLSPSMLNQIQEQSNIDYCLQLDKISQDEMSDNEFDMYHKTNGLSEQ